MLATYATVAVLLAACVVVGAAVAVVSGARRWTGLEPAVGLGVLIAVASAGVRLPGRATTGALLLGVTVLAAVAVCVVVGRRRGEGRERLRLQRPAPEAVAAAGLALALVSVPFLASWRVGVPGVSFNNDLAIHLGWADALRSQAIEDVLGVPEIYPLGPHALVAASSTALGAGVDAGFTGLLLTVPVLATLAALAGTRELGRLRCVPAALVVGVPYLVAAYTAQGAFKESLQALFVLAFALALREFALGRTGRLPGGVVAGVLAAATIYNYSYAGLAWSVGAVAIWLGLEVAVRWATDGRRPALAWTRGLVRPALVVAAVGLVMLLPELPRIGRLFVTVGASAAGSGSILTTNVGNLVGALPLLEGFGVWLQDDFRFVPPNAMATGVFGALALGATAYGVLWALERRDFVLPAALAAAVIALLRLRGVESPYLAAKAFVILTPLAMIVALRALLAPRDWPAGFRDVAIVRTAAACLLIPLALFSSYQALRGGQVGPRDHWDQLASLRPALGREPTLFLGSDDFVSWQLAGVPVAHPTQGTLTTQERFKFAKGKTWQYGQGLDFDSVAPESLDRFRYVITTRGAYQSSAPSNFRRVRSTPEFVLWKRTGRTPRRSVLPEANASGSVLDCAKGRGRRLRRQTGTATVLPEPVPGPVPPTMAMGASATVELKLPPGEWELSMPYTSPQVVEVSGGGLDAVLPANLGRTGPWWRVGRVRGAGAERPLRLTVTVRDPGLVHSRMHVASFGGIVATRPVPPREVPLREACGRMVDHYEVGAGRPALDGRSPATGRLDPR